jgi:filamentous hemagglutinin
MTGEERWVGDPILRTKVTQYGTHYNQVISITGANGKVIDVLAVWIELADGTIQFVTTYPAK